MAAALSQAELVFQSIEAVTGGVREQTTRQHHATKASCSGSGHAQAGPFRLKTTVPVVAEIVGDHRIIVGVLLKSPVHQRWIPAMFPQERSSVAVNRDGLRGD